MDLPQSPHQSSTVRSSNGCWTCRVRRKKCDEKRPVCDTCAALHITCHYHQDKPAWMDGGAKQEEMAERLKREVKENAHLRRAAERPAYVSVNRVSVAEAATGDVSVLSQRLPRDSTTLAFDLPGATPGTDNDETPPCPGPSTIRPQRGADCTLINEDSHEGIAFGRSDTILLMFYLEHLLPFLFPFYRPSLLQGGKAWVLEMMISSPVVRKATLCQSSYFFSLARGTVSGDVVWETVLAQTRDAFGALRRALQVIDGANIAEHLHGAVRILASIVQVQRFEIATSSLNNCQAHLNAALALFKQLVVSAGADGPPGINASFNNVMCRLGPTAWVLPVQSVQVPSAEQAAFRFSSALLIFDDIIASTVLQEQPVLYEYHSGLLFNVDGTDEPPINLAAVIGCQNWVLVQIAEIAVLDAWKQQSKRAGTLNVMQLVHCATIIKDSLETHITQLETHPVITPPVDSNLLDVLTAAYSSQQSETPANQNSLVTRVWAHATLLYLFVVVSGWQPANIDVRYHVDRIIELLTRQMSPPGLLRTMVWPFCVAGCLAEPAQEDRLRGLVEVLQPPSVFGTVRKALEIMENVWRNRDAGDSSSRDLAMCFRSQGDLVLLV